MQRVEAPNADFLRNSSEEAHALCRPFYFIFLFFYREPFHDFKFIFPSRDITNFLATIILRERFSERKKVGTCFPTNGKSVWWRRKLELALPPMASGCGGGMGKVEACV